MYYPIPIDTGSILVPQDEDLLHLTLPGILPDNVLLVVDRHLHVVSLLHYQEGLARIRVQVHFRTHGMLILLPILQSYPHYSPYDYLLSHLFPLPIEQCRQMIQQAHTREYEMLVRPLRRTMSSLSDGLHHLGLEMCSIRGVGYLLKQYHGPLFLH